MRSNVLKGDDFFFRSTMFLFRSEWICYRVKSRNPFFYDESLFRLTFRFHGVPHSFRYAAETRNENIGKIYEFQRTKVSRIEIKNFVTKLETSFWPSKQIKKTDDSIPGDEFCSLIPF